MRANLGLSGKSDSLAAMRMPVQRTGTQPGRRAVLCSPSHHRQQRERDRARGQPRQQAHRGALGDQGKDEGQQPEHNANDHAKHVQRLQLQGVWGVCDGVQSCVTTADRGKGEGPASFWRRWNL